MVDSPQNLYAKNLKQSLGYPLRHPEPRHDLPPSYTENGLHIGDVGYVDSHGVFNVLFNICLPPDHDLHQDKDLTGLQVGLVRFKPRIIDEIPAGRVICHGIRGPQGDVLKRTQSVPCSFKSCSTSGAILILPSGAMCQDLDEDLEREFYKLAKQHALEWSRFTRRKSLYLITGFYKTSSWHLASFHDVKPTGQVLLECSGTGDFTWDSSCDFRRSRESNSSENQAVLISGFKIEVRDLDKRVLVETLSPHPRSVCSQLALLASSLLGLLSFFLRGLVLGTLFELQGHGTPEGTDTDVHINRAPALSQPFHPSDTINRFFLDKNPDILVAISHDKEWMTMIEENEISLEDMAEEGRFRVFLEKNYMGYRSSDDVGYLQKRMPAHCSKTFSFPAISDVARHFVITGMRVENIVGDMRRMPVGFCVTIQFNGTKRRTRCKSASLSHSVVEWDDEIMLTADLAVRVQFAVIASFEFEPMLGGGEMLCTSETSIGKLVGGGGTHLLIFSKEAEDTSRCTSLLITIEERRVDFLSHLNICDSSFECEDHSCVEAESTNKGHDALVHYHRGAGTEKLLESVECFKRALNHCPPGHRCHAAALFNYATAAYITGCVHGELSDINMAIDFYRKALMFRRDRHPDRPRTLLHLAQALLYNQRWLPYKASVADEIEDLVVEIKGTCCENSYDYRAAGVVIQTLKRYKIQETGNLAEIDELVLDLDWSTRIPPDWHFDRPHRWINLGAALGKRFQMTGDLACLARSISVMEKALKLISDGHFDQPWTLVLLGDAFRVRFMRCGDIADLNSSISRTEHALRFIPDGHFGKPWVLSRLGAALFIRFACGPSVLGLSKSISILGCTIHFTPQARFNQWRINHTSLSIDHLDDIERAISAHRDTLELLKKHYGEYHKSRADCLTNIAGCLIARFSCLGTLDDLEEAVTKYKGAIGLTYDGHQSKPKYLNNLAFSLWVRFECLGKLVDLDDAMSVYKKAVQLTPDSHPDRLTYQNNLDECRYTHKLRVIVTETPFLYFL